MKKRHYCPTCGSPVLFPMELCQDLEAEAANWFEFLEAEEKSYGYMRKLRQRMRDYVLPEFSHRDVTKLQAKDVRMFYKKLRVRKLATRTIKHIMDTLRLFLCFLSEFKGPRNILWCLSVQNLFDYLSFSIFHGCIYTAIFYSGQDFFLKV